MRTLLWLFTNRRVLDRIVSICVCTYHCWKVAQFWMIDIVSVWWYCSVIPSHSSGCWVSLCVYSFFSHFSLDICRDSQVMYRFCEAWKQVHLPICLIHVMYSWAVTGFFPKPLLLCHVFSILNSLTFYKQHALYARISLQRHVTPSKFASPYRSRAFYECYQLTFSTPNASIHPPKINMSPLKGRWINGESTSEPTLDFQGFHGGISKHIQPKNHAPNAHRTKVE